VGEWGVADCIQGDYTDEEQKPDKDLGRTFTLGFRNVGFADPARQFGLPSVRTDVAPRNTSVATTIDFGDGNSAKRLLTPSAYAGEKPITLFRLSRPLLTQPPLIPPAELGVEEKDFLQPMAPGRLRAIFHRIGTVMSDVEFAAIWNQVRRSFSVPNFPTQATSQSSSLPQATEGARTPKGCVCLQEFRDALNEVLLGRMEGQDPEWFRAAMASAEGESEDVRASEAR
jgi:hypothetical protein